MRTKSTKVRIKVITEGSRSTKFLNVDALSTIMDLTSSRCKLESTHNVPYKPTSSALIKLVRESPKSGDTYLQVKSK